MKSIPKLLGALACCALSLATIPACADDGAALHVAVAAERALPVARRLPRAAFLEAPTLQSVQLSPDGRNVAYLREDGQGRSLWLLPTTGGAAIRLLARTPADQLFWSHDGRWMFLRAPDALSSIDVHGHAGMRVRLGGADRREPIMVDDSQAAAVVLREHLRIGTGEHWRLVRMDVRGQRTWLWEDPQWIHDIAFDDHGRLVALTRFEGDHDAVYRVLPGRHLREVLRLDHMEHAALLAATAQGELLLQGDAGGDLRRVLRLDAANVLHTAHADPLGVADMDGVVLDPVTREPLVTSYRSTVPATYGLGRAQAHVDAIRRRFPDRDLDIAVGSGPDAYWLVGERDGRLRDPQWHLYDPRSGHLRPILQTEATGARPLSAFSLARKIPLAYRASDGMTVRGFLLLPPGVDPAHAPLVAQVHGGPLNHFDTGYDSLAQFLANRGYVVFQSNFRGSTGYGRAYSFAAHGDFGNGRVQQDVVDGVRWLLGQGIGDAARVGIVGHSFGGYSTLLGVTFQPELFKVGVAGAAPADFAWTMRWLLDSGDQGARVDRSLLQALRTMSVDPDDPAVRARLHAQSPQAHAARLRRPLLLLAGGGDRTVPIRAVTHYAATLREHDKPVTLLVEPGGGHSPTTPLAREAYLFAMELMLQRHLGGALPEPPGARLRAYLKANLRLAGPEFAELKRQ